MAGTREERLETINRLRTLISEARQKGDNVAGLEAQLELELAAFNHVSDMLNEGKVLKG